MAKTAATLRGSLWRLSSHRLHHGVRIRGAPKPGTFSEGNLPSLTSYDNHSASHAHDMGIIELSPVLRSLARSSRIRRKVEVAALQSNQPCQTKRPARLPEN